MEDRYLQFYPRISSSPSKPSMLFCLKVAKTRECEIDVYVWGFPRLAGYFCPHRHSILIGKNINKQHEEKKKRQRSRSSPLDACNCQSILANGHSREISISILPVTLVATVLEPPD